MSSLWVLIIAIPPALVALAGVLDTRSRRGHALGLLAALVLALDIWGIIAVAQVAQQASASHTDTLGDAFVEAVYTLIGLYFALVLVLGGIAETIIARQRRWLALIVTVCLVLMALILAPATALVPDVLGALGLSRGSEGAALVLLPVLVTFVYAVARTCGPVGPRSP